MSKRKSILFVCVANSCRSQMGEALAKQVAQALGHEVDILSAGVSAGMGIDPGLVRYFEKKGISMEGHFPKTLAEVEPLDGFDVIVRVCDMHCAVIALTSKKTKLIDLPLEDPTRLLGKARDEAYARNERKLSACIKQLFEGL